MSEIKKFPINVGPPIAFGIPMSSAPGGLDFTTVTGVTLKVVKPDNTSPPSPWAASLVPAPGEVAITAVRAMVRYGFQPGDIDQKGEWRAQILFAVPSGVWPNDPELTPIFQITDEWGRP